MQKIPDCLVLTRSTWREPPERASLSRSIWKDTPPEREPLLREVGDLSQNFDGRDRFGCSLVGLGGH